MNNFSITIEEDFIICFEVYIDNEIRVHFVNCQNKKQARELEKTLKKLVKTLGVIKTENNVFHL